MRSPNLVLLALVAFSSLHGVVGSVFLPDSVRSGAIHPAMRAQSGSLKRKDFSYGPRQRRTPAYNMKGTAMAIPGYGLTEQVFVGGFANFLSIYNLIITARVLLSWIPQAQGVGFLQPVYAITDPYLNLFRGIIPPIGGLDLSPILAFVALNFLSSATAAVGKDIPKEIRRMFADSKFGQASARGHALLRQQEKEGYVAP